MPKISCFCAENLCVLSENCVKRSKCLLAGTRLQVEGRGPLPKNFQSKFVQHEPYLTAKFIWFWELSLHRYLKVFLKKFREIDVFTQRWKTCYLTSFFNFPWKWITCLLVSRNFCSMFIFPKIHKALIFVLCWFYGKYLNEKWFRFYQIRILISNTDLTKKIESKSVQKWLF